jgi:multidrug efflux pump subunit AcrA (membrane-fusion protein)
MLGLALGLWACTPTSASEAVVGEPAPATQAAQQPGAGEPGPLPTRLLLTGEINAAEGQILAVPRVPEWHVTLRWIEKDGVRVEAGQKVAELDDSAFTRELTQKKIALEQARSNLLHQKNESAITLLDKRFDVEQAQINFRKARLGAAVDRDSYPLRVYQEKQLELQRSEFSLEKAKDALRAYEAAVQLEARVLEIELERRRREVESAETAIAALSLVAPQSGIVVSALHPWFQRKMQSGDNVWVNLPLMRLPDLSTVEVHAWLSDVDDGRLPEGARVVTYLDAYPDEPFAGTVTMVSPVAREVSPRSLRRSFAVRIALDEVDPERMLPGMSVRVEVESDPPVSNGSPS